MKNRLFNCKGIQSYRNKLNFAEKMHRLIVIFYRSFNTETNLF